MASPRDIIRDNAVVALLSSGTLAQESVFTPRTWPTASAALPCIIVRTPVVRRGSVGPVGPPTFNSEVVLSVVGRIDATTEMEADELARVLCEQIETAILRNGQFIFESEIQHFPSVSTEFKVSAEAKRFIGEAHCSFSCSVFEVFEPNIDAAGDQFPPRDLIAGIDIKADLINVADPTGEYDTPTAPAYTPTTAPRTEGPDGRLEASMQINLEQ